MVSLWLELSLGLGPGFIRQLISENTAPSTAIMIRGVMWRVCDRFQNWNHGFEPP